MAARLEVGDIVVKDRRGTPDRWIDHPAAEPGVTGPFGAPSALHEFGRGAEAIVVAFAHLPLLAEDGLKSSDANDVEQTTPFALSLSQSRFSSGGAHARTLPPHAHPTPGPAPPTAPPPHSAPPPPPPPP